MGKILKYCSSCDEGFAEKFGFCPDCGAPLQAFEMNPLEAESANEAMVVEESPAINEEFREEPVAFEAAETEDVEIFEPAETIEEIEVEEPAPTVAAAAPQVFYQPTMLDADSPRSSAQPEPAEHYDWEEDGYHVTVIQEKNVKERNLLLLGSSILMLTLAVGATIVSLFAKDIGVGAIGDERSLALLIDEVPMPVEEEEQKKNDDKGGGGGGGGREDKEETSQGDLADQTRQQILIKPDVRIEKHDFELKQPPAMTEGDRKFPKEYDRYGDPNSKFAGLSNRTGSGGGQGSRRGTGQGSGFGTGTGSGTGSGSGSGYGDGNGSGRGDGDGGGGPPPAVPRVTSPLKILSKPKATYTDAARTNGVQGSVRLKVTLLASGAVGSITPVSRLPHGLTEQAIAAARQIRFEPKKVNGVPITTTVTFDYGFNIY